MTSDGQTAERLRDYLKTLKPEARAMLVAELERGLLRGEDAPGSHLVLQELRRTLRGSDAAAPRTNHAARLFLAQFEPFIVDDVADRKRVGRIARRSLEPIWEWMGRDLMPAEAKAFADDINRALGDDDEGNAELLTRALQDRALLHIREAIAAANGDDKARRRLAVQIGTPRAFDDIVTFAGILSCRDLLAEFTRRLPNHIRALEREFIDPVKAHLDAAIAHKLPGAAASKSDIVLYGLIALMSRLASPWQLIRIATRVAESDIAARIAETPYAIAVTIVINDVEWMLDDLRRELKAHRPVASVLKSIHDAARGLRTEIDLSGDSPWSRQLSAIRAEVSNILKAEIDSTPGRIRRLLRPRPARDIAPGSVLDTVDISEAETLLEFVAACRTYASELAVNEATARANSELQSYLESGAKVLLDALRQASPAEQPFRQSQMDAAIRFCRIVFGADYAGLLAKAAEIATHAGTAERKSVKA